MTRRKQKKKFRKDRSKGWTFTQEVGRCPTCGAWPIYDSASGWRPSPYKYAGNKAGSRMVRRAKRRGRAHFGGKGRYSGAALCPDSWHKNAPRTSEGEQ